MIALYRNSIEAKGKCSDQESKAILVSLCTLLGKLAALSKHPGLMNAHTIDNLGFYLDEVNPNREFQRLIGHSPTLKVFLKKRSHETLFLEVVEKLEYRKRAQCTPIRGTGEFARRLGPEERGQAEVVVDFSNGALLSIRQNTDPNQVVAIFTSTAKKRRVLSGSLVPEDAPVLQRLFEGAGTGSKSALAPEPIASTKVEFKTSNFFNLPNWYAIAMAKVAQNIFRLHVLFSATSQTVSRPVLVDRVTGHRVTNADKTTKTVIKTIFHGGSGGCICGLHQKVAKGAFKHIELRLELCGTAITEISTCPLHNTSMCQSQKFPGICAKNFKVELRCVHEMVPKEAPNSMTISFSSWFVNKFNDAMWQRGPLLDLASCGAKLMSNTVSLTELNDLKADGEAVLEELLRGRPGEIGSEAMLARDVAVVALLRKGGLSLGSDGKLKPRIGPGLQGLVQSHGQLFRRSWAKETK